MAEGTTYGGRTLEELRELAAEARLGSGEWDRHDGSVYQGAMLGDSLMSLADVYEGSDRDCAYVEAACKAVPDLVAELEAVRAERDKYERFLEYTVRRAVSLAGFLHGCLTDPVYHYGYPEQTVRQLEEWCRMVPKAREHGCPHSMIVPGCESCQDGERQRRIDFEIREHYGYDVGPGGVHSTP